MIQNYTIPLYEALRLLTTGFATVGLWSDPNVNVGAAGTLFSHQNDLHTKINSIRSTDIQDAAKPATDFGAVGTGLFQVLRFMRNQNGDVGDVSTGPGVAGSFYSKIRYLMDQIGLGTDAATADGALGSLQSKLRTIYAAIGSIDLSPITNAIGLGTDALTADGVLGSLHSKFRTVGSSNLAAARGDGTAGLAAHAVLRWVCDQIGLGTDASTGAGVLGSLQSKLHDIQDTLAGGLGPGATDEGVRQEAFYNCTSNANAGDVTALTADVNTFHLEGVSVRAEAAVPAGTVVLIQVKVGANVVATLIDAVQGDDANLDTIGDQVWTPCNLYLNDTDVININLSGGGANATHLHVRAWGCSADGDGGVLV